MAIVVNMYENLINYYNNRKLFGKVYFTAEYIRPLPFATLSLLYSQLA